MNTMDLNLNELKKWFVEKALPVIRQIWERARTKLFDDGGIISQIKDNAQDFIDAARLDVSFEKVDVLSVSNLVEFSKNHMVAGSDGVVAIRKPKDESVFVFLAYVKDRDLLPEETNHYVVVEAKSLADDTKELFGDLDLVILN